MSGEINTSVSVSSNMDSKDTQNNIYIIYKPDEEKVGNELEPSPKNPNAMYGVQLGRSQALVTFLNVL